MMLELERAPSWLEGRLALWTTVGSRMRGTERPGSDWDWFGVCVEPLDVALGVRGFDQFTLQDGKTDVSVYGLRRACQMALKGNPSLVENLHAPFEVNSYGAAIATKLRELCRSEQTLKNFGGYLRSQAQRLERGTNPEGKRAELVEKYGYDVKFAAHAVRLGLQGLEYAQTGHISLPLNPGVRSTVNDVLAGEYTKESVIWQIGLLDKALSQLIDKCDWPKPLSGPSLDFWCKGQYLRYDRVHAPLD